MKKTLRALLTVLLLASLLTCLCACGIEEEKALLTALLTNTNAGENEKEEKSAPSLLGKWDALNWICAVNDVTRDQFLPDASAVLEFKDDGIAAIITFAGGTEEINNAPYTVSEDTIALGGMKFGYVLTEDCLTLTFDSKTVALPRVK